MSINRTMRVLVIVPFLAAVMALGGFAFASSASAAGGAGAALPTAMEQNCDNDAVGCDYLGDYGIGCINGDIVGDVNGTAINCDVDGDVNGTIINGDATGNVQNCINGDPGSVSGSSINCGSGGGGYTPGPNPNPNPNPNNPGTPNVPGNPAPTTVVALPDTGVGAAQPAAELTVVILATAVLGMVALAGSALARRER